MYKSSCIIRSGDHAFLATLVDKNQYQKSADSKFVCLWQCIHKPQYENYENFVASNVSVLILTIRVWTENKSCSFWSDCMKKKIKNLY